MMPPAARMLCQFVSGSSVTEIEFMDHPDINENAEGPVDRCQPYAGVDGVDFHINIFGT